MSGVISNLYYKLFRDSYLKMLLCYRLLKISVWPWSTHWFQQPRNGSLRNFLMMTEMRVLMKVRLLKMRYSCSPDLHVSVDGCPVLKFCVSFSEVVLNMPQVSFYSCYSAFHKKFVFYITLMRSYSCTRAQRCPLPFAL